MTTRSRATFALMGLTAALMAGLPAIAHAEKGDNGARMLQHFDEMDADKDGKVTKAEVQAYRDARFAVADTDKNGSLSADELSAMQMTQMQARLAQRSKKMIDRLDANADGQLSAEEFATMGKRQSMFDRVDADNDGVISKDEVQKMGDRGGKNRKGDKDDRGWWWMDAN
ncbi:MAG: EF-hand domain-containing protein [Paracoccaceae bacterium]